MMAALHQQDVILFMIDDLLLTFLLDFVKMGLLTLFKYVWALCLEFIFYIIFLMYTYIKSWARWRSG